MVGKHNDVPDSMFNAEQLRMGIGVEMEHTDDVEIAKSIAKDHLSEISDYYNRLVKMEFEAVHGRVKEGITAEDVGVLSLLRNIK